MKKKSLLNRKCSAAMAAGAGAAVCLAGGGAGHAAVVTGAITASNGGSGFSMMPAGNYYLKAFNSPGGQLVRWRLRDAGAGRIQFSWYEGFPRLNQTTGGTLSLAAVHPPNVTVSVGMANDFALGRQLPSSLSDVFLAVKFRADLSNPDAYYGWIHIVSSNAAGTSFVADTWGYDNTPNTSIKTLSESVTTRKLSLSNGQVKLHWTNGNEDGVARYEVQTKDASGEWHAVDSDTPGEGHYAAMVDGDAEYRLVVEKVDGETEEIDF